MGALYSSRKHLIDCPFKSQGFKWKIFDMINPPYFSEFPLSFFKFRRNVYYERKIMSQYAEFSLSSDLPTLIASTRKFSISPILNIFREGAGPLI